MKDQSGLEALSEEEYKADFLQDEDPKKARRAFEKAWEIRNFEIEMYWKRATYFWAFIASAFVGYFSVSSVDDPDPDAIFILVCIGIILSVAWFFTNKGSKSWQRHWEVHVDLLEDRFTGPLYKTVYPAKTFSVSKINEIVSACFIWIWVVLGIKFFMDYLDDLNLVIVVLGFLVVAVSLYHMAFGKGRGRFSERAVQMHRRKVSYKK